MACPITVHRMAIIIIINTIIRNAKEALHEMSVNVTQHVVHWKTLWTDLSQNLTSMDQILQWHSDQCWWYIESTSLLSILPLKLLNSPSGNFHLVGNSFTIHRLLLLCIAMHRLISGRFWCGMFMYVQIGCRHFTLWGYFFIYQPAHRWTFRWITLSW